MDAILTKKELITEYIVALKHHLHIVLVVSVANIAVSLVMGVVDPLGVKFLLDNISNGRVKQFVYTAVILLFIYAIAAALRYMRAVGTQSLHNKIRADYAKTGMLVAYKIPYSVLGAKDSGYYISRIIDESEIIASIAESSLQVISNLTIAIAGFIVCLFISWKVSIVVTITIPLVILIGKKYGSKISALSKSVREAEAVLRGNVGRNIKAYKSVVIYGLHKTVASRVDADISQWDSTTIKTKKQAALMWGYTALLLSTGELTIFIGAGVLVLKHLLSIGSVMGFISAYWRVIGSVQNLQELVPTIAGISASIDRRHDLSESAVDSSQCIVDSEELALVDLVHRYDSANHSAINGLTMKFEAGDKVLIRGDNGVGKSTLMNLIAGFIKPTNGSITERNSSIISGVLNNQGLVAGTSLDNLKYKDMSFGDRKRCIKMARSLGVSGLLRKDVALLSSGELKKISLLMSLMKSSNIYIFDEPLANVDDKSARAFMDLISVNSKDALVLFVAHGNVFNEKIFNRHVTLQ